MKTGLLLCGGIVLMVACGLIATLGGGRKTSLLLNADVIPDKPSDYELAQLHQKFVAAFERAMGNGLERMSYEESRHKYKHFGRDLFSAYMGNSKWNVDQFLLVGNIYHEGKAAVFKDPNFTKALKVRLDNSLSQTLAKKADLTREPDAFETQALQQLEDGKEFVVNSGTDKLRMVGAIRAKESCLGCHSSRATISLGKNSFNSVEQDIKAGDLLGAFTYRISRP